MEGHLGAQYYWNMGTHENGLTRSTHISAIQSVTTRGAHTGDYGHIFYASSPTTGQSLDLNVPPNFDLSLKTISILKLVAGCILIRTNKRLVN